MQLKSKKVALYSDVFYSNELIYQRSENGFLLYSSGANGRDDKGNCMRGIWGVAKLAGQELFDEADPRHELIPAGADDISLRIPVEYPPWPWERKEAEE